MPSTIHTRLTRALCFLAIGLTALQLCGWYTSRVLVEQLDNTARLGMETSDLLADLERKMVLSQATAWRHVSSQSPDEMARAEYEIGQWDTELGTLFSALQTNLYTQPELDALASVVTNWEAYVHLRDGQWLPASRNDKATALVMAADSTPLGSTTRSAQAAVLALRQAHLSALNQTRQAARQRYTRAQLVLLFGALATIICTLAYGLHLSAQVASGLRVVVRSARQIVVGDWEDSPLLKSGDELELLAESLAQIGRNTKRLLAAKREADEQGQRQMSETRLARAALETEQRRFAATLSLIDNSVIVADSQGRVTAINRAAERHTGWAQEEAIGQPIGIVCQVVHARTHERCADPLQGALQPGGMLNWDDTILVARNGHEQSITSGSALIQDSEGNLAGIVFVFLDSERQRQNGDTSHTFPDARA